jgi:hypothetical protein
LLGGHLTFLIGPGLPLPAPPVLLANLEQVSVTHNDSGRSGFQLTLGVGRNRTTGLLDYPPLLAQLVRAGNRVLLVATLGAMPTVIMDGLITNQQLSPSAQPGESKLTVTGEDLSVAMDLHELKLSYPCMADWMIATTILGKYAVLGVVPRVIPHPADSPPAPTDTAPMREGTDMGVLNEMAGDHGYVFYVDPGPVPGTSTAYWGPPVRAGIPQRALTLGMGAHGNLNSIQFQSDATKPKVVYGLVQEATSGITVPVLALTPLAQPLSALPALFGNAPFFGSKQLGDDHGGDVAAAMAAAFAEVDSSNRDALTASGELDVGRYGSVLKARALVDVRGVGLTFDGTWYVKSVTHTITRGSYKQSFNLEREGMFPLLPVVRT